MANPDQPEAQTMPAEPSPTLFATQQDQSSQIFDSSSSSLNPSSQKSIQILPDNLIIGILSRLNLSELKEISHLCRLFHSTFLHLKEKEERRAACNFINLPSEIWVHEIMSRLDRDNVRKIETICTIFRDHVHNHRLLKLQLFREKVDNKALVNHHQELEKDSSSKKEQGVMDGEESEAEDAFKIKLHPSFLTEGEMRYSIERSKNNVTTATPSILGYGTNSEDVKLFHEKHLWDLEDHQMGRETASEPAVGWFRFDFEEAGKQHRGTSDRYPTSNGHPKAVNVKDVMFKWIQLEGGKNLASWYNSKGNQRNRSGNRLWKKEMFLIKEGLEAKLVKKGNSVGMEISNATLKL